MDCKCTRRKPSFLSVLGLLSDLKFGQVLLAAGHFRALGVQLSLLDGANEQQWEGAGRVRSVGHEAAPRSHVSGGFNNEGTFLPPQHFHFSSPTDNTV